MIKAKDLAFRYPRSPKWVFQKASLELRAGQVLCILGPNGIGKSTLLKCLSGLLKPEQGMVQVDGKDLANMSRAEAARKIAYVPQFHSPVFAFSVVQVVVMGRTAHLSAFQSPGQKDQDKTHEALAALGIEHLADRPYTELSGGERQLVMFARVLAQEAKALLLDEPTSHLDFGNQAKVLALIRDLAGRGLSVLMTSHFPDHAYWIADQAAVLHEGRLSLPGTPEQVLSPEKLNQIYGVKVRIIQQNGQTICAPILPQSALKS